MEYRDERVEVAAAGSCEEGIDYGSLPRQVAIRTGVAPCTRRRARLASCRVASGERSIIVAIWSNGTSNMSWSTNANRSGGESVSS